MKVWRPSFWKRLVSSMPKASSMETPLHSEAFCCRLCIFKRHLFTETTALMYVLYAVTGTAISMYIYGARWIRVDCTLLFIYLLCVEKGFGTFQFDWEKTKQGALLVFSLPSQDTLIEWGNNVVILYTFRGHQIPITIRE